MKKIVNITYLIFALFIVIFPAVLAHLAVPLKLNVSLWEKVIDILMVLTAVIGLGVVIYRKRSKFKGWIPLLIILLLVILPQLYLWKSQSRGFNELRIIYRFALLYITLFVVPLDIPSFPQRDLRPDRCFLPVRIRLLRL